MAKKRTSPSRVVDMSALSLGDVCVELQILGARVSQHADLDPLMPEIARVILALSGVVGMRDEKRLKKTLTGATTFGPPRTDKAFGDMFARYVQAFVPPQSAPNQLYPLLKNFLRRPWLRKKFEEHGEVRSRQLIGDAVASWLEGFATDEKRREFGEHLLKTLEIRRPRPEAPFFAANEQRRRRSL